MFEFEYHYHSHLSSRKPHITSENPEPKIQNCIATCRTLRTDHPWFNYKKKKRKELIC